MPHVKPTRITSISGWRLLFLGSNDSVCAGARDAVESTARANEYGKTKFKNFMLLLLVSVIEGDILLKVRYTVTPRNTGCQGTNKFPLLLADFRYCHYRKLKEMTSRDQGLAFVIGGLPLLLGPVLRGLTVRKSVDGYVYPLFNIQPPTPPPLYPIIISTSPFQSPLSLFSSSSFFPLPFLYHPHGWRRLIKFLAR